MTTDIEVKKNVEQELQWDPGLDASQLGTAVKDGVVTLSGTVHHYWEKVRAERAVERVKGVYGLANDIEVLIGTNKRSDAEIARDAVSALRMQLPVSAESIKTVVDNGNIRLEGQVHWAYLRQRAESAVRHVQGVRNVFNHIKVAPEVSAKDIQGEIQAAFHRNAQLEANRIRIEVSGNEVILHGTVNTLKERKEAENAAWMAPGVSQIRNNITIGP